MPRRLILLCAFLLMAEPAAADEVLLTNGDHLTGQVVSLAGGTLTFETPHGELRIVWTTVAGLVVDEPILVTTIGAEPAAARVAAGDVPGRAT
ncbi:MAG: hypothetical protein GEU73_17230, partial [Chloroflexi bacterium]|nr:hypothetical protein [Chloroflexota bacterium]